MDYNDELEKFRLNISMCANHDIAHLRGLLMVVEKDFDC